ncbi:protein of unknown function [Citrobacter amalonaticus]|nr:protein of unknown function [Citrobacter amalonaticus]
MAGSTARKNKKVMALSFHFVFLCHALLLANIFGNVHLLYECFCWFLFVGVI